MTHFTKTLCVGSLLLTLGCQTLPNQSSLPDKNTSIPPLTQSITPPPFEPITSDKAKNIILFIGDGMGLSTITAARILDGQNKGLDGEAHMLSFERFGDIALVKTYNLDSQVPDSAGTASAISTGLKTQIGKINVQPNALNAGCSESGATPPQTLADIAKQAGRAIGIVSTTRLTHATPAAIYGHSHNRNFETDRDLSPEAKKLGCLDLARQMVDADIDLALGGGRRSFKPEKRDDKIDLTADWARKSPTHKVITSRAELNTVDTRNNILGLFSDSHMSFETDRPQELEPSLTEMTEAAIDNLAARGSGYFLMVEAGRIDHAHHGTNAYRALSETIELSRAVKTALARTDPEETLILVTADHSHVFTIAGYPQRGNPILGLVKRTGTEDYARDHHGNPYTTLGYHNGPHVSDPHETLTDKMVQADDFQQRSAIKLNTETHAGEDVVLYAYGAGAQKVRGVIDQKDIFDIIVRNFEN